MVEVAAEAVDKAVDTEAVEDILSPHRSNLNPRLKLNRELREEYVSETSYPMQTVRYSRKDV